MAARLGALPFVNVWKEMNRLNTKKEFLIKKLDSFFDLSPLVSVSHFLSPLTFLFSSSPTHIRSFLYSCTHTFCNPSLMWHCTEIGCKDGIIWTEQCRLSTFLIIYLMVVIGFQSGSRQTYSLLCSQVWNKATDLVWGVSLKHLPYLLTVHTSAVSWYALLFLHQVFMSFTHPFILQPPLIFSDST